MRFRGQSGTGWVGLPAGHRQRGTPGASAPQKAGSVVGFPRSRPLSWHCSLAVALETWSVALRAKLGLALRTL